VLGSRQDGGVRVGGEHDAGVTELILDRLEVGAGGVGKAGRAVPEIMQPDRRQPAPFDQVLEPVGEVVRVVRPAGRVP
jgi:hypothetical protein